jgi:hypothetical protein
MLKLTNIDFDYDIFLKEYNKIKDHEVGYSRGGRSAPHWRVIRDKNLNSKLSYDYAESLKRKYNILGKTNVSFYRLLANETLPWHIDTDTKCAINFILNGEAAPVIYEEGTYTYKQALIRTDINHKVINGDKDRILFKISIFDMDFDDVAPLLP